MAALRSIGLGAGEKFIPHTYKTASRADRLAVLAGVLDTDGYYDGKCFYLTLKCEQLLDDTIFVARSLGFAAYKKPVMKCCTNNGVKTQCFSTVISGDLETIPVRLTRRKAQPRRQKKDPLVTGLSVEGIGEGDYYGFEIDGDHLFLLGDFTVTHNTKIAKLIISRFNRMTLFLTTRGILLYQMKDQLDTHPELFGETGIIGDGSMNFVKGVNLGMVQTLVQALEMPSFDREFHVLIKSNIMRDKGLSRDDVMELAEANRERKEKRRNAIIRFLSMIEVVIGEEAHEAGGASYYEILRHCKNATIRIALTATPFMRSSAEDNMRLMAAFGPVLIDVPEDLLIARGILARPYFRFVNCKPHPKLRQSSPFERAYTLGYIDNEFMHAEILKDAMMAKLYRLPVLTLVARKKHGENLVENAKKAGLKAVFLKGEDNLKDRKQKLRDLSSGEIDMVVGTNILDVGVDVPAIGLVQLAGGMKAEVALRQRIGRGLRAKKGMTNVAFIADYSSNVNSYLRDHARQRENIVRSTKGFVEGILEDGQDFDWSLFADRKLAKAS